MPAAAPVRRQLRPVIIDGAGDVTVPVDVKFSAHEDAGGAASPVFALGPPTEQPLVASNSQFVTSATSLPAVASTGVLPGPVHSSSSIASSSTISSSTASATSSSATLDSVSPSTTVLAVTSSLPPTASTSIASSTSISHSDLFYAGIALAATGGVAAILLLLAWWTRVRARSRRRWELASRSSSTTNFDLLWQPSRDRDVGEPKRDFSLPTKLPASTGAVVRDKPGAFDLVNAPVARARPILPCELQPSETSLRAMVVCASPRPTVVSEKPFMETSRRLVGISQGVDAPREGPYQFRPQHLDLRRDTVGIGIREPALPSTAMQTPEQRYIPASNINTWSERLQARRPLPEQPPADVAFGESWLESIHRRVFVGPDVHVPQSSTDFGPPRDVTAGIGSSRPTSTYASHVVTSPVAHPAGFHNTRPHDPPGLS